MYTNYPEDQPEIVGTCCECGEPIYSDGPSWYKDIEGNLIHQECVCNYCLNAIEEKTVYELADMFCLM